MAADPLQWMRAELEEADWPLPSARAALIDNMTTCIDGTCTDNIICNEGLELGLRLTSNVEK